MDLKFVYLYIGSTLHKQAFSLPNINISKLLVLLNIFILYSRKQWKSSFMHMEFRIWLVLYTLSVE